MRYLLLLVVFLVASGCAQPDTANSLCSVIAHPEHYLGKNLTLAGVAQMYQHSSTLRSESCSKQNLVLELDPNDNSDVSKGQLTPAATFFSELAVRGKSSVVVSGRMTRSRGVTGSYALIVDSGVYK